MEQNHVTAENSCRVEHRKNKNIVQSQLKVLMSPVATYWFIACHLTNLHGIFYGNELSKYFDVDVEKLEDYIAEFS